MAQDEEVQKCKDAIIESVIMGASALIDSIHTDELDKSLAVLLALHSTVQEWGDALIKTAFLSGKSSEEMLAAVNPSASRHTEIEEWWYGRQAC